MCNNKKERKKKKQGHSREAIPNFECSLVSPPGLASSSLRRGFFFSTCRRLARRHAPPLLL